MNDTVATVVLLTLVALRIAVICTAAWLFIPKRRHCPHCSAPTMALVSPRWMGWFLVQRRWCTCGWTGWSKHFTWRPRDGDGDPPRVPPPPPGRAEDLPRSPTTPSGAR